MSGPLDHLLGYQLKRASAAMMADLAEQLADLGLHVTAMSVLLLIDGPVRRTQSDIGRELGIQRANMAPLTATLAERGLIDRVALDRRSHALALTPAGRAMAAEARARVARHELRFLARVPEADRAHLIGLLAPLWHDPP